MKVSELRRRLGQIQLRHGDVEVCTDVSPNAVRGVSFFQLHMEGKPIGEPMAMIEAADKE